MIGVFVKGRRWCRESCLVVGRMLGHGSLLNGAMEHTCGDGAPEQDTETKHAEDGAYDNEDSTVGIARSLHVGRIRGGRHGRCGIGRNGSVEAGGAGQGWHIRVACF